VREGACNLSLPVTMSQVFMLYSRWSGRDYIREECDSVDREGRSPNF
jgi:hypothetical protein